jgi:hypothetical protein
MAATPPCSFNNVDAVIEFSKKTVGGDMRKALSVSSMAILISIAAAPAQADLFVSGIVFVGGSADGTVAGGGGGDVWVYDQLGTLKFVIGIGVNAIPAGVAFGPDGKLYVASTVAGSPQLGGTVQRYDPATGKLLNTVIQYSSTLVAPQGMVFGPDGNLYVADTSVIRQYDASNGALLGSTATLSALLIDVAFGSDGNLYTTDYVSGQVLKFSGTTLALMGAFVTHPAGYERPLGLKFGPGGNLFVLYNSTVGPPKAQILAFDGTTGAQLTFTTPNTDAPGSFAFGPDGNIYVPLTGMTTKYNGSTGASLGVFALITTGLAEATFDVFTPAPPPPWAYFRPLSVQRFQTLRVSVAAPAVPAGVPTGGPVQAVLGFVNSSGEPIGPSSTVSLNPGQVASLDLNGSTLAALTEIRPVVTSVAVPGAAPGIPQGALQASAEVFDTLTGFGSVLVRGKGNFVSAAPLVPQGVAYGQIMRTTAAARSDTPCSATLRFADSNGAQVGPTATVNLSPGQSTSLDFSADSLTGRVGHRIEVQPQVGLSAAGAPGPVCEAAVEVLDPFIRTVSTRQDSVNPLAP